MIYLILSFIISVVALFSAMYVAEEKHLDPGAGVLLGWFGGSVCSQIAIMLAKMM